MIKSEQTPLHPLNQTVEASPDYPGTESDLDDPYGRHEQSSVLENMLNLQPPGMQPPRPGLNSMVLNFAQELNQKGELDPFAWPQSSDAPSRGKNSTGQISEFEF